MIHFAHVKDMPSHLSFQYRVDHDDRSIEQIVHGRLEDIQRLAVIILYLFREGPVFSSRALGCLAVQEQIGVHDNAQ